ncbi:MAG: alpha-L-rhamnosidase, partial [Bacteroidetes bacterium]
MPRVLLFLFFLIVSTTCISQVKLTGLLTENRINPVGLDADHPRFTWQIVADRKNLHQTAYEIAVNETGVKKSVWGSGKVMSDQSVQVPYGGPKLQPGKKYSWQVKVWDNFNRESGWSESSVWQTGFFDTSSWKAKWIEPGYTEDASRPSPLFRKEFTSNKKVQSAIVYITCHGLYEATINGQRIGDSYLTPGWTSYNKRLQYQVYDVT